MKLNNFAVLLLILPLTFLTSLNESLAEPFYSIPTPALQTGDLIFQISQSPQAAAISESTGSQWSHVGVIVESKTGFVVYEAVQPVKITALKSFIARGKNQTFVIKRVKSKLLNTKSSDFQSELTQELSKYLGLPYDIYFEWSEDRIYCSEYAFKAYVDVAGLEIGTIQKTGELRLDGPNVKKLILDRLTSIGKKVNLEEPMVTPVSMYESTALETIFDSRAAPLTANY